MAHTIEEMREARAALCREIASKIADFEDEYGVKVGDIEYCPEEFKNDCSGEVFMRVGRCRISVII